MVITNLTEEQVRGLVERWYSGHYSKSSFRTSPMALGKIISEDTDYTLRTRKQNRGARTILEIIAEQISFERINGLCHYDSYKDNL